MVYGIVLPTLGSFPSGDDLAFALVAAFQKFLAERWERLGVTAEQVCLNGGYTKIKSIYIDSQYNLNIMSD